VILASFTDYYLPMLSTITTLLALGTVYFARRERREEVADKRIDSFEQALRRVAHAVVDLADAAEHERRRRSGRAELFGGTTEMAIRAPLSVRIATLNLRAAIFALPTGGSRFPKCRVLVREAGWDVDPRFFVAALDEVGEAPKEIAERRATQGSPWSQGPIRGVRARRASATAGVGDPS
jgi:hypothetical protein